MTFQGFSQLFKMPVQLFLSPTFKSHRWTHMDSGLGVAITVLLCLTTINLITLYPSCLISKSTLHFNAQHNCENVTALKKDTLPQFLPDSLVFFCCPKPCR